MLIMTIETGLRRVEDYIIVWTKNHSKLDVVFAKDLGKVGGSES